MPSIYQCIKQDHDDLRDLLNDLNNLADTDAELRHDLINDIRDHLIPHSRAEESVFYNSIRAVESGNEPIMHSFQEHMEAETLLRTLQIKDKIDADWKRTAEKLQKALEHHMQEEETRVFELARNLFSDEESEKMASAFEKLKPEVQREGFLKNTLDMVANLMPPRFSAAFRMRASQTEPRPKT